MSRWNVFVVTKMVSLFAASYIISVNVTSQHFSLRSQCWERARIISLRRVFCISRCSQVCPCTKCCQDTAHPSWSHQGPRGLPAMARCEHTHVAGAGVCVCTVSASVHGSRFESTRASLARGPRYPLRPSAVLPELTSHLRSWCLTLGGAHAEDLTHGRRGRLGTRLFHSEHTITCCLVHTSGWNVDSSFQNVPEAQPDGVCLEPPSPALRRPHRL